MTHYKEEWQKQATIDYFGPFLKLWVACNSWYNSKYGLRTDRDCINSIKEDYSTESLFTKFDVLITANSKEGLQFRNDLEQLHYSLERADIKTDNGAKCTFTAVVTDLRRPVSSKRNLIEEPSIDEEGNVDPSEEPNVIRLDKIFITSNKQIFFSGLFEIIYRVRCNLVHGNMNPGDREYDVVKYCYSILSGLMD